MKQISLHKQELCDIIKLKQGYIIIGGLQCQGRNGV